MLCHLNKHAVFPYKASWDAEAAFHDLEKWLQQGSHGLALYSPAGSLALSRTTLDMSTDFWKCLHSDKATSTPLSSSKPAPPAEVALLADCDQLQGQYFMRARKDTRSF